MRTMEKICKNCNVKYETTQNKSKFCTKKCRQNFNNKNLKYGVLTFYPKKN